MKIQIAAMSGFLLLGPAAAGAQSINDAQIASIVVTANQVDIDAGELAKRMAIHPEVKKFGEMMATDHTGVNKAAVDLATKLKVTPEENETSRALEAGGEKNIAHLKALKGAAFDKAYIEQEIAYHTQVLEAIDKTLIPNTKNAELKGLLVKVRPAFVAHLEQAKQLQATLSKTK
jgi:putative membrane protein